VPPATASITLRLPDADRLDEDPREAEGVHELDDVARRGGEASETAAGGHAADEDVGVERVGLHPDAVAQDGAARERARRVDGDHADA